MTSQRHFLMLPTASVHICAVSEKREQPHEAPDSCDPGCLSQDLKEERQHAATLERQMHELEASSGASQVQAAELAGLRDRVTTLTTQLKVGKPSLCHTGLLSLS